MIDITNLNLSYEDIQDMLSKIENGSLEISKEELEEILEYISGSNCES